MAYRGITSTIPVGLQGFHGSRNPSKLGPGHLSLTEGLDYDGGVLIKEGGAEKLNSTALNSGATILAGTNWSPVPGEYHDVVVLDDGDVLKDTGAGTFGVTLTSGLSNPTIFAPFFAAGGGEDVGDTRKLFMFSEANQVQVVSGTADTMAAIATPPSDWASAFPTFGVYHESRIWGGGNANDPHRIYYSTSTDHGDYQGTGSGQLPIFPGEGEELVGGVSFNGILILWKFPKGIYIVDTRDPDSANWKVSKLTSAIGGVSPQTIFPNSGDILFMDNSANFHLISAVNQLGDINTSNISRNIDLGVFARANLGLGQIRKSMGVWYAAKSKAWFMVPSSGSPINNVRISIDFNEAQIGARYLITQRDVGTALWLRPDANNIEVPALGDDDGFVWLMDQEERTKDDVEFDMEFETAEMDFGFIQPEYASVNKNGQALHIVADVVQQASITITPFWDGVQSEVITASIGSTGAALGSFVLGTDVLAASGLVTTRNKLKGSGKRLRLRVESNEDVEVRIAEFRVSYTLGDDGMRNA